MLLSLCMGREVTLPSLCGFSGQSCRDPRPGEQLGAADPKLTLFLGTTLGLGQLHGKLRDFP